MEDKIVFPLWKEAFAQERHAVWCMTRRYNVGVKKIRMILLYISKWIARYQNSNIATNRLFLITFWHLKKLSCSIVTWKLQITEQYNKLQCWMVFGSHTYTYNKLCLMHSWFKVEALNNIGQDHFHVHLIFGKFQEKSRK